MTKTKQLTAAALVVVSTVLLSAGPAQADRFLKTQIISQAGTSSSP